MSTDRHNKARTRSAGVGTVIGIALVLFMLGVLGFLVLNAQALERYFKENVAPASRAYAALAREHGLTPSQLALAFCYRRQAVASTLIGVTSSAQLRENIDAWAVQLADDVVDAIDALHLRYTNPAP